VYDTNFALVLHLALRILLYSRYLHAARATKVHYLTWRRNDSLHQTYHRQLPWIYHDIITALSIDDSATFTTTHLAILPSSRLVHLVHAAGWGECSGGCGID
jgi:hypothetical protein